jgi:hypothetical protein
MSIPHINEIKDCSNLWRDFVAQHSTLGFYAGEHKLKVDGAVGFFRDELDRLWVKTLTLKEKGDDLCQAFNLNKRDTHMSMIMIPDAQVAYKYGPMIVCAEHLFVDERFK